MAESTDFHFRDPEEIRAEEPLGQIRSRPPIGPWIVLALLAVAAGAAVYIVFGRRTAQPQPETKPPAVEEAAQPLGGKPEPITVPPLNESDPLVRELVRKLSTHPRVLAWLTTEGLIRNFTTVVSTVADGRTPASQLRPLRLTQPFQVVVRGATTEIDPRSYDRYNGIAEAVEGIDPAGAAQLYSTLKPRIEEAYGELGIGTPFDRALERAIVRLLETPVRDGPIRLVPRGIVYGFEDPNLEDLSPAQKQLLRFGPRSARLLQAKLRDIALALGIPASRLPTPSAR